MNAVPMIARNAAWVAMATQFPNSDLIHSEEFARALASALSAAAPHLMAEAWDASADEAAARWWMHEVGVEDVKARNPYRSAGVGE